MFPILKQIRKALIIMMLQKKIDRAMSWLKEKSNPSQGYDEDLSMKYAVNIEEDDYYDPKGEWEKEGNKIQFEAKDIGALIISAFIVFGPIFLILIAILIWAI